jgi:hypothetical protein
MPRFDGDVFLFGTAIAVLLFLSLSLLETRLIEE